MAQLIRAAKSGIHWSAHELLAFNIAIQDVDRTNVLWCAPAACDLCLSQGFSGSRQQHSPTSSSCSH
ncbi:hypothetical protein BDP27DRAFT_58639 [Rhodocollybia butyracea]|uniref:Uncharacterized protein n=1 Tax=Rhodocollybia butyracea TaxID=206335 RepID=A0A9P5PMV4_9AGAR|nr:hypothetical protein BDP27DRAFT_58639 [Rhodocollybia butyracea]